MAPRLPKMPRGGLSQAADPLAQLVAARMAGQLQGVSQLPGLGGLSALNIPAAYAGDQRSLQAVQRGISEAETGLPSPGRRKFMKQTAATAARSAIPDSVANALGTTALKKAVGDAFSPEIPEESIQAATAMAMDKVLGHKALKGLADSGDYGTLHMLLDSKPLSCEEFGPALEAEYGVEDAAEILNKKDYNEIVEALSGLNPESIAAKSGLPADSIYKHFEKVKMSPENAVREWLTGHDNLQAWAESNGRSQFNDYGFDELPDDMHMGNPEFADVIKKARAGVEIEDSDYDEAMQPVYDMYWRKKEDAAVGPHKNLLGPTGYSSLLEKHGDTYLDPVTGFDRMTTDDASDGFHERLDGLFQRLVDNPPINSRR